MGAMLYNKTVTEIVVPVGITIDWAAFSSSTSISRVYYCGSAEEWQDAQIDSEAFPEGIEIAYLSSKNASDLIWSFGEDGKTPILCQGENNN